MPTKRKIIRKDPAYLRKQGSRKEVKSRKRNITFSLSKQIKGEGQSSEEWQELGHLSKLFTRIKYVGQYSTSEVRQKQYIKEYSGSTDAELFILIEETLIG